MNIGEMQRKLGLWAQQDKNHKFFDLYHLLYDKDWLRLAHDYVKQNAGSTTAGCDGINMSKFDDYLEENLHQIANKLKTETFQPYPVRRVYIPKSGGKLRPLGIPSIRDRIVQEALRMILEPIYEADFSKHSFGFRPNLCTMDAVSYTAISTLGRKKFYWIIEGDISSYFDSIHHRRLMKTLRRRIKDEKLLRLVWKFLRAGVMEGRLFRDTKQGTPQGGIVSPLLANIYLNELDKYMDQYTDLSRKEKTRRREQGLSNYVYVRYADDFVVLCNGTKQQAESLKEELCSFLYKRLRLTMSKEKTKITHLNDGFNFLGFRIHRCLAHNGMRTKILIPKEAIGNLRDKIKACLDPTTHQDSVNSKIRALNRIISGWCRYYQYTSKANTQFNKVEHEIYWKMVHWLGRKYQLSTPQVIRRFGRGDTFATTEQRLKPAGEYSTLRYRKRLYRPSPYTTQEKILREELAQEGFWTGYEERRGIEDLRPIILERDGYECQMCREAVTSQTAQIDHIRPYRRFKRPVEANEANNLWVLCNGCHKEKTEIDRQRESPLR